MKRDVLDNAVSLVEDSEHRHPLRHWSDTALAGRGRGGPSRARRLAVLLLGAFTARCQRQRDQERCGKWTHAYSGIQGS
jgi:hypothetical protein